MSQRLYELLAEHLTERKRALFEKILDDRTRHITFVLEDLYQPQNTSAIQRSAESFGIQDLYLIENNHSFAHHRRIARGAYDWLTMHRYNRRTNNTAECLSDMRAKGYQIVVTTLHEKAVSPAQIDLSKKTAILMGTELKGASVTAMEMADAFTMIPTFGFTESLNVGAAAAILMQNLTSRMRDENQSWQLSEEEKLELKIRWAKRSIYWSKYIIDMYEAGEIS